jgi:hypothetical protein
MEVSPECFGHLTAMLMHDNRVKKARLIMALEGGYNVRMVGESIVQCVRVLLGEDPLPLVATELDNREQRKRAERVKQFKSMMEEVVKIQSKYWNCMRSFDSLVIDDVIDKFGKIQLAAPSPVSDRRETRQSLGARSNASPPSAAAPAAAPAASPGSVSSRHSGEASPSPVVRTPAKKDEEAKAKSPGNMVTPSRNAAPAAAAAAPNSTPHSSKRTSPHGSATPGHK